jgi:hypothetical protein
LTDLFENPVTDPSTDIDPSKIYEELVGEGKKFSSPVELARGKYEADQFIERLKREAAELRNELNTRLKMEEVLDRLNQTSSTPPASSQNNQHGDRDDNPSALTPEKIAELVESKVAEREALRTREQNLAFVRDELTKVFGSDYVTHLNRTAQELGFSQDQVRSLAGSNPKALLKLVGAQEAPRSNDPLAPPRSSVQTPLRPQETGLKNKAYFDKIKQTDAARYWSPAVQNEMHREALRLGEKFFT